MVKERRGRYQYVRGHLREGTKDCGGVLAAGKNALPGRGGKEESNRQTRTGDGQVKNTGGKERERWGDRGKSPRREPG